MPDYGTVAYKIEQKLQKYEEEERCLLEQINSLGEPKPSKCKERSFFDILNKLK